MNKQLLLGGNDRAETDEPAATVDADRPVTCDADKPLRLIDWFWSYSYYYYYYYLTARLDCGVLLSQEPFDDTSSVKSSSSSHFSHIYYWTTASTRAAWPPSKYPRELADRLKGRHCEQPAVLTRVVAIPALTDWLALKCHWLGSRRVSSATAGRNRVGN